jgi:ABC-2 type transport system permease protein
MNILRIAGRIMRQIANDHRTLGLVLVVPLLLFTLLYFLLGPSNYRPTVVYADLPQILVDSLAKQDMTLSEVSVDEGLTQVKDLQADALIYAEGNEIQLVFESNDAVKSALIMQNIQNAVQDLPDQAAQIKKQLSTLLAMPGWQDNQLGQSISAMLQEIPEGMTLTTRTLYGESDASSFDTLGYVLLGVLAFFFVFIIAGISFVRERLTGTMERLMITPVRRIQVVLGYTAGFAFFGVLQSVLLLVFARYVLGLHIAGSLAAASLVMLLLALSAVCMGAFFSIFAHSEFQVLQFIPIVVIPQVFFSGLISLDTFPYHLGELARIMPVYYACDALKSITVRGWTLLDTWPDLLALLAFVLLFSVMNVVALKKYRRI